MRENERTNIEDFIKSSVIFFFFYYFFITSKLMLNLAEFPALTTMKLLILASVNRGLTMMKIKVKNVSIKILSWE